MRTEYTIRITNNKGKVSFITYPKKYADEEARRIKQNHDNKGDALVEYFKVTWNGSSVYKAEKIF